MRKGSHAGLAGFGFTLATFVLLTGARAAQDEFDARREQEFRQHDFDVRHYRIALTVDDRARSFVAETAVTFSSTVDGLDELALDAETFVVERVSQGDVALPFTQEEGTLHIALDRVMAAGDEATVVVEYAAHDVAIDPTKFGMSAEYPLGFNFNAGSDNNPPVVHTMNFPEGARHWFPSYDHPGDWATHETIVTLRSDYSVVANGTLVSDSVDTTNGLRTVHWSQEKPQPTYLYVMVAGAYSILEDSYGELPLHYRVYAGDEEDARLSFSPTPGMVGFFEELYGVDFPWVKYDQIVIPGIGGGAESTSATVLGSRAVKSAAELGDSTPNALLAHELAHQWWGDFIGYRDWDHIWLSESFATHSEYLYALHDLGADEAALTLHRHRNAYLQEAATRFIRPIVTNKWDWPDDMFDRHTYQKGAVVLNMFRELVGAEAFAGVLQTFLETHAYSNATTADFVATVRDVTGTDYGWFFDQWLMKPGHPVLSVSQQWDAERKLLTVIVEQIQDRSLGTPIYRVPVRIGITTASGKTVEDIWLDEAQQIFRFDVAEQPLMVRFDEGDVVLKLLEFDKPTAELLYQLGHDTAIGRMWAISELGARTSEADVLPALLAAARDDEFRAVRESAVRTAGMVHNDAVMQVLEERARNDSNSQVRAAALEHLGEFRDDALAAFFRQRVDTEESPLARAAASAALEKLASP